MLYKIALCTLFSLSGIVAKSITPPLDQKKIHEAYKNSDFDVVSNELETYSRLYNGRKWLRDDSVFLYKHLAVINSASHETLEKGKYYMVAMLRIMPSAEILDMYVSEEIDRIFRRTRQEFLANMHKFGLDTTGLLIPTSPPSSNKKEYSDQVSQTEVGQLPKDKKTSIQEAKSGSSWGWWTAGGLAVAAVGTVTYYALHGDGQSEKINVIDVPSQK